MKKLIKKALAIILATQMLLSVASMSAFALSETETLTNLTYELKNGVVTITDCNTSASGEMIIPSSIDGYAVTSISNYAFSGCTGLTSITIPDGVTSIGYSAFGDCTGLTSMVVDTKNKVYDSRNNCNAIIETATNTLVSGCKNTVIPDSVTSIGWYAFSGCTGLTSITIPDSVTSIGHFAFSGCTGLTSITIPDSVISIGYEAFSYTGYFDNPANWENDVLYINNHLIYAENTLDGAYTIKEGTKTVGPYAFYNCTDLTSITIPDSVTSINYGAFSGCTGLTSITIPDSVASIGDFAFYDCTGLTSITIPDSVTSLGDWAFHECTNLASVTIPDSITSIGNSVFSWCTSLKSITIPDSVVLIDSYAFLECTSLTSVVIPDSVVSMAGGTFADCTNLKNVVLPKNIKYIGQDMFAGCTSLTSLTIPDGVVAIQPDAFWECTALTDIVIPDSVVSIGQAAFDDTAFCNDATNFEDDVLYIGKHLIKANEAISGEIVIKDGTKTISPSAFYNCKGLTNVLIPDSVVSIGAEAFHGTDYYNNPENWENDVLYIGNHLIEAKETVGGAFTVKEGTKSIADAAFEYNTALTSVTIPNGLELIGDSTFSGCTELTSVTMPDGVKRIGWFAFEGCTGLTSIRIPESVTSIGAGAFSGCQGIKEITIPGSVNTLEAMAFTGVNNITISDGVKVIEIGAFAGDPDEVNFQRSIIIPNSVEAVSKLAFYVEEYNPNLPTVFLEEGNKNVYDTLKAIGVDIIPYNLTEKTFEGNAVLSINQNIVLTENIWNSICKIINNSDIRYVYFEKLDLTNVITEEVLVNANSVDLVFENALFSVEEDGETIRLGDIEEKSTFEKIIDAIVEFFTVTLDSVFKGIIARIVKWFK